MTRRAKTSGSIAVAVKTVAAVAAGTMKIDTRIAGIRTTSRRASSERKPEPVKPRERANNERGALGCAL